MLYKLSFKNGINSHPWAVTSQLQSGTKTRNTCVVIVLWNVYICLFIHIYSLAWYYIHYARSNSISIRFVQGRRGHDRMVVGNLKSYGGHWVIRSGRWCRARAYNTTKVHDMNMATYDKSICFCHIWIWSYTVGV